MMQSRNCNRIPERISCNSRKIFQVISKKFSRNFSVGSNFPKKPQQYRSRKFGMSKNPVKNIYNNNNNNKNNNRVLFHLKISLIQIDVWQAIGYK